MMKERVQLLNEATVLWQALVPVNEKKDDHTLVVSGLAPLTTTAKTGHTSQVN